MRRQSLLTLSPDRLADLVQGSGRARAIWHLLSRGHDPREHADLGQRAQRLLSEHTTLHRPKTTQHRISDDGCHKLVLRLDDGAEIELVLIPGQGRSTLCVSTQVGCAHGCLFCRTGTMGLIRQLTSEEILQQVWLARGLVSQKSLPKLRNIVFMGMGEPLDNLQSVAAACAQLVHPRAFAFGPQHLTVSTVAPSPKRVVQAASLPVNLAWSLHAADAGLRKKLVPSARHPPEILRNAFVDALDQNGRDLFVEVVLLDAVNDTEAHARSLAKLLAPLRQRCRINLLPVNTGPAERDHASSNAAVEIFKQRLRDAGFFCMQRQPRGQDIDGACGMLVSAPQQTHAPGESG